MCLEFVIDGEGRERTVGLFWVEALLPVSKLEALSVETSEKMQRKWVRPVFFALSLLTISVTCFSCL